MAKNKIIAIDFSTNDAAFVHEAKVTFTTEDGERYTVVHQFAQNETIASKRDAALQKELTKRTLDTDDGNLSHADKKRWF